MHKRHELPRVWKTRGGQPREVAMGVGMMMTGRRLAGVLIPVILLVMHVYGVVVLVEVGWIGMREEHPMPLSAHTVVNDHMHRRPEKGDDQTQAYQAHNHEAYLCDALHVKKTRGNLAWPATCVATIIEQCLHGCAHKGAHDDGNRFSSPEQ